MRNNKKGFTLLELVVVVLVSIVIMTTVALTFTKLIKKAKLNADATFLVAVNELIENSSEEIDSIEEALVLINKNGYNEHSILAKLSSDHFVFDTLNNRFLMIDDLSKVVYEEVESCVENWQVLVVEESDLMVKGNLWLYNDITLTSKIELNANYNLDLNDHTLTTESTLVFKGDKNATVINGNINAKAIILNTKDYNFGNDSVVVTEDLTSNANVKMLDNANLNIKKSLVLGDNSTFVVSGNHTLKVPSNVVIGKNVQIASNLNNMMSVVSDENKLALTLSKSDDLYISDLTDFKSDENYYYLSAGYHCLRNNITLDKPLMIEEGSSATLNFTYYSLTFSTAKGIVNNGSLKLYGNSTSKNSASILGGKEGIYNYGILSVNNVNIVTGNGIEEDGFAYYESSTGNTYGIFNAKKESTCEINGSTIKANIGIYTKSGNLYINKATVVGVENALKGAGTIKIGITGSEQITFTGKCLFENATRDITIGIMGKENNNIVMPNIVVNGSQNYNNYCN